MAHMSYIRVWGLGLSYNLNSLTGRLYMELYLFNEGLYRNIIGFRV